MVYNFNTGDKKVCFDLQIELLYTRHLGLHLKCLSPKVKKPISSYGTCTAKFSLIVWFTRGK